jgi:hypothetical protein
VLGAVQIMHLYRTDRSALTRLSDLQLQALSGAAVLHPPDRTPTFADPNALYRAYARRQLVPLPADPGRLGLAYDHRSIGSLAHRLHVPAALYRGLRAPALDLLVELAARVRALSGRMPLILGSAVTDHRYQDLVGDGETGPTTGYQFSIERRYVTRSHAAAFQSMLDRLQALDLIAWVRLPSTIQVTVASDASRVIVDGP